MFSALVNRLPGFPRRKIDSSVDAAIQAWRAPSHRRLAMRWERDKKKHLVSRWSHGAANAAQS